MAGMTNRGELSDRPEANSGLRRPNVPDLNQTFEPSICEPYCPYFPEEYRKFLGRRPLVGGESGVNYDELVKSFAAHWKPRGLIEWMQLKEQIDAIWEKLRLQALKDAIIRIAQIDELSAYLEHCHTRKTKPEDKREYEVQAREVLNPWVHPAVVNDRLEELGTSSDEINARAFPKVVHLLDALTGMVLAQDRREAAMRRGIADSRWMSEKLAALPAPGDLDDDEGEEV